MQYACHPRFFNRTLRVYYHRCRTRVYGGNISFVSFSSRGGFGKKEICQSEGYVPGARLSTSACVVFLLFSRYEIGALRGTHSCDKSLSACC